MKQNKPANLNGLPPAVATMVKNGVPMHKAMSMSMLKTKAPKKKK